MKSRGYALLGVFQRLFEHMIRIDLPVHQKAFILKQFGEIEGNINKGAPDKVQLGALIGSCRYALDMIEE